jgi:diguanylate cyclase (GGDEF)-like protein/PAS domain S-box-containing protein
VIGIGLVPGKPGTGFRPGLPPGHERLRQVVEHLPVVVYAFDVAPDGTLVNGYIGPQAGPMLGYDPAIHSSPFELVHPDDRDRCALGAGRFEAGDGHRLDYRVVRPDGEVVWVRDEARAFRDPDGTLHVQGAVSDINELIATRDRLDRQATHDALTGLPNRAHLYASIATALDAAHVSGSAVGLLFCDLDAFKEVNDTLGHAEGDRLLVEVAERLTSVMPPGAMVARLGGDEFSVLLRDIGHVTEVERCAQTVVDSLAVPFHLGGRRAAVGVSIGIARYPEGGAQDTDGLVRQADAAMYLSKRSKGGWAHYAPEDDAAATPSFSLLADLRAAIELDQFELAFQPRVAAGTDAVRVVEAVVRWRNPVMGILPAMDFLPIAERSGLARRIDDLMLGHVAETLRLWHGGGFADVGVAVRLSAASLADVGLPGRIAGMLASCGVHGRHLEVEIGEHGLLSDPRLADRLAARLAEIGVRVVIGDFGTGYTSIASLHRLRAAAVKLSPQLVHGVSDDSDAQAIVESIIMLSGALGLETIAAGVDTAPDEAYLRWAGATLLQGWQIAPEMDGADLVGWLTARDRPAAAGLAPA